MILANKDSFLVCLLSAGLGDCPDCTEPSAIVVIKYGVDLSSSSCWGTEGIYIFGYSDLKLHPNLHTSQHIQQ